MSASSTKNVAIGVCRAYLGGIDLGYTQGGVDVEVSTQTHAVTVDQFGKTNVDEIIMGRTVKAKIPMVETTISKMAMIMPGATVINTGGAIASGSYTFAANPSVGQNIVINGLTVTFKVAAVVALDVTLGSTLAATLIALAAVLSASTNPLIAASTYVATATTLVVTFNDYGLAGNVFPITVGTTTASVSAATLLGGLEVTSKRIQVVTGIGISLLSIAKELRFHPIALATTDYSQDFVIPIAMTSGAVSFAYKLEAERVFTCEFFGYPDPVTGMLYYFGT